nr:unnamed protein product [Digitaria exilis]
MEIRISRDWITTVHARTIPVRVEFRLCAAAASASVAPPPPPSAPTPPSPWHHVALPQIIAVPSSPVVPATSRRRRWSPSPQLVAVASSPVALAVACCRAVDSSFPRLLRVRSPAPAATDWK